jgi:hypothetical protein
MTGEFLRFSTCYLQLPPGLQKTEAQPQPSAYFSTFFGWLSFVSLTFWSWLLSHLLLALLLVFLSAFVSHFQLLSWCQFSLWQDIPACFKPIRKDLWNTPAEFISARRICQVKINSSATVQLLNHAGKAVFQAKTAEIPAQNRLRSPTRPYWRKDEIF